MRRFVIVGSVVILAALTVACGQHGDGGSASSSITGPAGADGKPSAGGSSNTTFRLVMVSDANGDDKPNWGDQVTFDVATTATSEPHVDLKCTRDGDVILGATTGFFPSYPWPWTQTMTLSSPSWTSGSADCTATLYYFAGRKNPVLATIRFTAGS